MDGYEEISGEHSKVYVLGEELFDLQREYLRLGMLAKVKMQELDEISGELDDDHLDKIEEANAEELAAAGRDTVAKGRSSLLLTP